VPLTGEPRLNARERWLFTQVALHMEAGLRLRVLPGAEVARLRLDGRALDVIEPEIKRGAWREKLGRHVATVEQERTRARRARFEAIDAWTALTSGRWVLVEREERGIGRYYAVVEAGRAHSLRALTDLEVRVAELSARGLAGKAVSYALGVAPATVSKHLGSAALKLGFNNRTRLVQGVSALLGVGQRPEVHADLTRSERDVLNLVRRGWSNARIASERQRSERTVANQVSALLHKLRVPSRRALASMPLKSS
jgi:DNA-binding NarL/FixJ family response regulator